MKQEDVIPILKLPDGVTKFPNVEQIVSPYTLRIYAIDGTPIIDNDKAYNAYELIRPIRNLIVESAILVESSLTVAILHFMVGVDYVKQDILRSFVFEAEFCTFMQKRKMLSKIFDTEGKNITCISKEEAKYLRKEINNIILERDKFAHGIIIIDCKEYQAMIQYHRNGTQIDKIKSEHGDEIYEKCQKCIYILGKLTEFFKSYSPSSEKAKNS